MELHRDLQGLVEALLDEELCGFNIKGHLRPQEEDEISSARNGAAAFILAMAGVREGEALLKNGKILRDQAAFWQKGIKRLSGELNEKYSSDNDFRTAVTEALETIKGEAPVGAKRKALRRVFFPEGALEQKDFGGEIRTLRERRTVTIQNLNESPLSNPGKELIFTSNVLLTVPPEGYNPEKSNLPLELCESLERAAAQEQQFWYDHPIQIGTPPEKNEVLYGLKHLNGALAYEKERGNMDRDARALCILSVSVTHPALQEAAGPYIEWELRKREKLEHLDIYVFTESDTELLLNEALLPAARRYFNETEGLERIFGVNGEYGRHYSFLKAIAALWQVLKDRKVRATFKIDLDQVFPQERLLEETGECLFEHFKSPLWGAVGTDSDGNRVSLSMIAGALVNERDFGGSIFTPDVPLPKEDPGGESLVFYSPLPQAISTEAEMMTRYTGDGLDGRNKCIQRIHVTGGTNGIFIDALRRFRPFTPTFIGRAEDQAYILSVLFKSEGGELLRYVHKDGLIMRHDKEAFAGEAIEAAKIGKLIGDYVRTLIFSQYAKAVPGGREKIKRAVAPFTGGFISPVPVSVVSLRFALKALEFFERGKEQDGHELIVHGCSRIDEALLHYIEGSAVFEGFAQEKKAWDLFYDVLVKIEENSIESDSFACDCQKKGIDILTKCRIPMG